MENLAPPAGAVAYDYAVAGRAMAGERQSGDAALVQPTASGALVAVVDGLGHGAEAAAAAGAAIRVLREHAGEPLPALLQRCHAALLTTRGAAIAVVALDAASATLSWSGVGNVEAVLVAARRGPSRPRLWLTNGGGVVGYLMPPLQARAAPIFPGDLLILASDGIDDRFAGEQLPHAAPGQVARWILDRYGKWTDDALVLVLRWRGEAAANHCGDRDEC